MLLFPKNPKIYFHVIWISKTFQGAYSSDPASALFASLTFRHGQPVSWHSVKGRLLNQKFWLRKSGVLSFRPEQFDSNIYDERTHTYTSHIFYYKNAYANVIQFYFKHSKILLILLSDCFIQFIKRFYNIFSELVSQQPPVTYLVASRQF